MEEIMRLAIFDFDGTIYRKETFTLLMHHLKTTYPKRYRRFFATILPVYIGYKLKIITEKNMKAKLMESYMKSLKDLTESELDAYFTDIAHEMKDDFNQSVVERLQEHKQAGDYTMILSGAFTPLMYAVDYQLLTFESHPTLGTELPRPDYSFIHIHAEQKPVLLYNYLESVDINWDSSSAYGDSIADLSVLEMVGHPIAVCPDKPLNQVAEKQNWEIIL